MWNYISNKKSEKNIENYNQQFLQYLKDDENGFAYKVDGENVSIYKATNDILDYGYTDNVEGLINTVTKNNKNERKVTMIYQDKEYTSADELNVLLNGLDTNKKHTMECRIDLTSKYITEIELGTYIYPELITLLHGYYRDNVEYLEVRELINRVYTIVTDKEVHENVIINVTYNTDTNQTITLKCTNDITEEEYKNLRDAFEKDKKYNIKIKAENKTCDILITCDNY